MQSKVGNTRRIMAAIAVLLVVVFGTTIICNEVHIAKWEEAKSQCWEGVADSYCEEASLSDDGKCVRKILPDGAQCRVFKADYCNLSCVCKDGLSQKEKRDCSDGNPCTMDQCGYQQDWRGDVLWKEPFACSNSFVPLEGARCGDDQGGVCFHGFCVMLYDTIYTDFP